MNSPTNRESLRIWLAVGVAEALIIAALFVPWTEPLFGGHVFRTEFDVQLREKWALFGSAREQSIDANGRELFPPRRLGDFGGYTLTRIDPRTNILDPPFDQSEILMICFSGEPTAILSREVGASKWTIKIGNEAQKFLATSLKNPEVSLKIGALSTP